MDPDHQHPVPQSRCSFQRKVRESPRRRRRTRFDTSPTPAEARGSTVRWTTQRSAPFHSTDPGATAASRVPAAVTRDQQQAHPRFLLHESDKTPGEVFLECRAAEGLLFRAVQRHHPAGVVIVPAAIAAVGGNRASGDILERDLRAWDQTPALGTAPGYSGVSSRTMGESRSRLTRVARSFRQPFRAEMAPDPRGECCHDFPILNVQRCGCSSNPPEGTARNMAR